MRRGRIPHERRRSKEHPVDDAEHRRIRADSEPERRDDRDGKARPSAQAANGVLEILSQGFEGHVRMTLSLCRAFVGFRLAVEPAYFERSSANRRPPSGVRRAGRPERDVMAADVMVIMERQFDYLK